MKKKNFSALAIILVLLLGIGFMAYPFASNWLAQNTRNLEIREYDRSVENMQAEEIEEEWEKARAYNESNKRWQSSDAFSGGDNEPLSKEYLAALNMNGMMGYIEIPSIGVYLPMQHGTSEKTLSTSVGHLARSHLPIGGSGNHAVLTGHTALPTAVLFSNLSKVAVGDMFYLHVLGKKLAYQVDDLLVVVPQDVNTLYPVDGEDYVTLITCTPYGINSHRLLVRGTRVELPENEQQTSGLPQRNQLLFWIVVIGIFLLWVLCMTIIIIILVKRKKRKEAHEHTRHTKK